MYIRIILLVFKIERHKPVEKDWLNRNARWSDMFLFINFKILVGTLFGPLLLSRFKKEIILETSVLSAGVIKNDLIFKGGTYTPILFWEHLMED